MYSCCLYIISLSNNMKKENSKVKETKGSKNKAEKFNMSSGEKIKHFMDIHGYTAEKLSSKLDKEKRTYFYKIKNETDFTMTEAWIMTKIFNCTLDDLVKDFDEMNEYEKSKYNEIINGDNTEKESKPKK